MSLTEIKEQIPDLTADERLELAAMLSDLEQDSEESFRTQVAARMKAMDQGRKLSQEEFETRHGELEARGR